MNPTAPLPGALGRWLRIPRPRRDPRLRLICFSYAGGNAATYHAWSDHLPGTIEVCGVQLPGRAERFAEPPFTRMSALLAALEPLLSPWLRGRPFAFFGHSLGAVLAFELTRRLRRHQGPQPLWLFVSGCPAPQLRYPEPMHSLPRAEFLERLRQMDGMPEEVLAHEELLDMVLPTVQADFELEETREYLDEEPLDIPITALGGTQDDTIAPGDLEAWSVHTRSTFSTRMIPGNHFFIDSRSDLVINAIHEALHSGDSAASPVRNPSR